MTPWDIRAIELANCNCAYGCPCQFNALPTYGNCHAVVCMEITEGHFGEVKLDGVRFGGVFSWPRAIHEGNGEAQPFVDSRATEAQRDAVLKIMTGQETAPMATVFAIFASTLVKAYDPIFVPIEFSVDVDARRGQFVVPGVAQTRGEPIKNPLTGAEYRARIDIPDGFEYEIAEIGSASSTTQGNIAIKLENSYAQFAHLHLNNNGVVKHRSV